MLANNNDQAFLDILNLLTVDQLKPRFKSCPAAGTAPTRKAELISAVKTWLSGNGLALVWQSLSPPEVAQLLPTPLPANTAIVAGSPACDDVGVDRKSGRRPLVCIRIPACLARSGEPGRWP